jgi:hypothetical protein
MRGFWAIASMGLASAAAALAQPAATDLGTLTVGTPVTVNGIQINAGTIVWYTITVPAVQHPLYLDIDSEGSLLAPSNDTEIGVYRSDGTIVTSDDDDGNGLMSQISFGATFPTRPPVGSGLAYNGRDGSLVAGTYYLSVSGFNTTFGTTNWTVTSTSTNTGQAVLNLNLGQVPPPPPGSYVEIGDAAELPGTAQSVDGSGALNEIRGVFAGDADMYLIEICDAANFSASTVGGSTADTQLFVFNLNGTGVIYNDDDPNGTTLQSNIGTGFISSNGQYLLAISGYNRDPVDAGGALLWINTPFDVTRAPDGPGAANPVANWINTGASGAYIIALTGACFIGGSDCPGDVDGDGDADLTDLATLLTNFGTPSNATREMGDLDGDGDVDLTDLASLLTVFGSSCP